MIKLTRQKCKEIALKYKLRKDFNLYDQSAYVTASRNGWLKEFTKHMIKYPPKYDFEKCRKNALKYKTRSEWFRKSSGHYQFAWKNNWLDKCCKHMIEPWSKRKK